MIFIRPYSVYLLPLLAGMLLACTARAADDVTAQALKLYEMHHYEEAARLLRPQLVAMDSRQRAPAQLALGMIYLRNSSLYRELAQTAQLIELDYLHQLSAQKTGTASRFVNFYLGQALLQSGNTGEAITYLRRFVAQPVGPVYKAWGEIELGVAYSRQKQAALAKKLWARQDLSKAEIKAALAGAYAAAGERERKPSALADAALSEAKAQQVAVGSHMLRNVLRAYSDSGEIGKALDLLSAGELKQASYVEDLGDSKTLSFYDLGLLDDMARLMLRAAQQYLELAAVDAKVGGSANYYLLDAYLQQGNTQAALQSATAVLAQAQVPAPYREHAQVLQAAAQYRAGERGAAVASWHTLADKAAQEPVLLADVLQTCVQAGADCSKLAQQAVPLADKGEGKKYFLLNAALGKYYLARKDYAKAVLYMEAGRDKANKNKIEANDPQMLIALAEAYYRSKSYSENLEIYFELGKQYPLVRQIQEAMQGIYSAEHQSAGDVKIF